jgi:hypothetical protein
MMLYLVSHRLLHSRSASKPCLSLTKPPRRFPPPWTFEEYRGLAYIVRDANRFAVAYVYFASEVGHSRHFMTKDEARTIAAGIAKLPELLQHKPPKWNGPGVLTAPGRSISLKYLAQIESSFSKATYRSATELLPDKRLRCIAHTCA